jgi:hypothetical protein
MNHWLMQVYALSDDHAAELILGLLSGIDDLVVQSSMYGTDHFLVVECVDQVQARSVRRLVTAIDFNAKLVHSESRRVERATA